MPPFASGVTTRGLAYRPNHADLGFGTGLGVCNEFDDKAVISVENSLLLLFVSKN
jgi:thiamine pyrophosphokinase